MTTKTVKKDAVRKKVTKKVNGISLTLSQANALKAALNKAGKSYKFLDSKIEALAIKA